MKLHWTLKLLLSISLCLGLAMVIGSCGLFKYEKIEILPPTIPGASFVGNSTCEVCHEEAFKYFKMDPHFTVQVKEKEGAEDEAGEQSRIRGEGCEGCHGPGSLHAESEGDRKKIIRYSPEMCFSCHVDKRGQFQLQFHHPVPEGRMTCMDCHEMHGRDVRATSGAMLKRREEKCFACHKEQKGPFVFEHDAMREGCQACHNPHGSVHDKLLVAGDTTTCLRCHWEQSFDHAANPGGPPTFFGSGNRLGGVPHNYFIGRGEECVDHHRAPHGSNIWRTLNR